MRRNTSVSLGSYFDTFVGNRIQEGRYKNASEVIRAGLRLLEEEEEEEEEENRVIVLKTAIREGIDSGIINDFNSAAHLQTLKEAKRANG